MLTGRSIAILLAILLASFVIYYAYMISNNSSTYVENMADNEEEDTGQVVVEDYDDEDVAELDTGEPSILEKAFSLKRDTVETEPKLDDTKLYLEEPDYLSLAETNIDTRSGIKNPSYSLLADPPIPQKVLGPFMQSTIEPSKTGLLVGGVEEQD